MSNFYSKQQAYWDSLARLDPDNAIIDPRDRRGWKNAYLSSMRDEAFASKLGAFGLSNATVLDFGCGTGSASIGLRRQGHTVVGLDISPLLLKHARARCSDDGCIFAAIDGRTVPVQDATVDACTIYGVICYVPDDAEATALLRSIRATMKAGAPLLMIEQSRRQRTLTEGGMKVQRTTSEWLALLATAGFIGTTATIMRHGRFPTTPLIRYGLLPPSTWRPLARFEKAIAAVTGVWPWDYADVFFSGNA
ncbi:MAG: class I SAM-dependent methyltransferase [Lysobacteraceae bacterium]